MTHQPPISNSCTWVQEALVDRLLEDLKDCGLKHLFIEYGVGKHRKFPSVNKLSSQFSTPFCKALSFFHAFTGCDTVSAFHSVGKVKAWNVFRKTEGELIELFHHFSTSTTVKEESFGIIQQFIHCSYVRPYMSHRVCE